jgi:hypothetical protein
VETALPGAPRRTYWAPLAISKRRLGPPACDRPLELGILAIRGTRGFSVLEWGLGRSIQTPALFC